MPTVTANQIIGDALSFHLNRLSPGETVDTATAALCLSGLNSLIDEFNFSPTLLQQEVMTTAGATSTGLTLTYGTTWTAIQPGTSPLGLNAKKGDQTWSLEPITMQELQQGFGSDATEPLYYAFDGLSTIHLRGAAAAHTFTIRHRVDATAFADGTTTYTVASGMRSTYAVLLAELMAEVLVGKVPPRVAAKAAQVRRRLKARGTRPDILNVRRPKEWLSSEPTDEGDGGGGGGETPGVFGVEYEKYLVDFEDLTGQTLSATEVPTAAVGELGGTLTAYVSGAPNGSTWPVISDFGNLDSWGPGLGGPMGIAMITGGDGVGMLARVRMGINKDRGDGLPRHYVSAWGLTHLGALEATTVTQGTSGDLNLRDYDINPPLGWGQLEDLNTQPVSAPDGYASADVLVMAHSSNALFKEFLVSRLWFTVGTFIYDDEI